MYLYLYAYCNCIRIYICIFILFASVLVLDSDSYETHSVCYENLFLYFICICICICICVRIVFVFVSVSVLDYGSYQARSVCCDSRTIRRASPRKPDTSPCHGTAGRNSNLALALLAPAQLAHLGFGTFGSGRCFLGGKAAIANHCCLCHKKGRQNWGPKCCLEFI